MGKYLIMIGGVFAFIGLCVMCCGGGAILLLIAAAMIVIGFVVNDIQLKSELKKDSERWKEDMENNHKISFYEDCVREGIEYIDDFEKTGKFEKAKLIAEQYSISIGEIREAFSQGEQLYREREINAIEQNILQLKREEDSLRNYLTRYSEYIGRDKKLAMLRDELNILEQQLSGTYDSMESSSSSVGYKKEQSWAIHGGLQVR